MLAFPKNDGNNAGQSGDQETERERQTPAQESPGVDHEMTKSASAGGASAEVANLGNQAT